MLWPLMGAPAYAALTFVEAQVDGQNGVDGLAQASSVALSPDGAHVSATGTSDSAVAVFRRNSSTGALSFIEAQIDGMNGVSGLTLPSGVAVSPDGAHVYVTSGASAVAVFRRDSSSGRLTFVEAQLEGSGNVTGIGGAHGVAEHRPRPPRHST